MKRNLVLPNLKLRQMNIAGIFTAAIFQIFMSHKGAGSLLTNPAKGIVQKCFGWKHIASAVTRVRFKGKIIPQIQCFLWQWPQKDTEQGERGEEQQCSWSISDTFTVQPQPRIL